MLQSNAVDLLFASIVRYAEVLAKLHVERGLRNGEYAHLVLIGGRREVIDNGFFNWRAARADNLALLANG